MAKIDKPPITLENQSVGTRIKRLIQRDLFVTLILFGILAMISLNLALWSQAVPRIESKINVLVEEESERRRVENFCIVDAIIHLPAASERLERQDEIRELYLNCTKQQFNDKE